jgi:hypothetical protein
MPITETFDEACSALADFLRREDEPSEELLWLCREDITGIRRRIFVHPSPPSSNRDLYRQLYESGVQQGRGLWVVAAFTLGRRACCYVWVPRDDIDASYAMLSDGLRLSIPSRKAEFPITARQCRTAPGFYFRRTFFRLRGESPIAQDFLSRCDINANTRNG